MFRKIIFVLFLVFISSCNSSKNETWYIEETWEIVETYVDTLETSVSDARKVVDTMNNQNKTLEENINTIK